VEASRSIVEQEAELKRYIPELDNTTKAPSSSKKAGESLYLSRLLFVDEHTLTGLTPAFKNVVLSESASESDILLIYGEYDSWFGSQNDDSDDLMLEEPVIPVFSSKGATPDSGIEAERHMSYSALSTCLDFEDGVPFLFNDLRDNAGEHAWSPEFAELHAARSSSLEPFHLLHHQLVGVHAILRRFLSSKPIADGTLGVLLADDVGIGKTIQSAAVIAFLAEIPVKIKRGLAIPPFLREFSSSSVRTFVLTLC
jgi:SNF2 family DNA or RNA helicase